jgi:hypothetical protein
MRTRKSQPPILGMLRPEGERVRAPAGGRRRDLPDVEIAIAAADVAARSGDWDSATPKTFVGLYAWCHRATYHVDAQELLQKAEFVAACRAASKILQHDFEDDGGAFALFIRWAWKREKERVEWAQRQRVERGRLGWRLLFSPRFVTDYRVSRSQAAR